ncbi:MAG: N-acetylmuramidase family protein, partial [Muribaculaceae bacterium]|nr:N-acetylmuramidase family protein [Muribaculaceae bacterium]
MAPMRQLPALVSALTAAVTISAGAIGADEVATHLPVDDLPPGLCGNGRDYVIAEGDTVWFWTPPEERRGILTERDYEEVAAELGVEVAAIKAVVEIEAGKAHQGFWDEGKPVINFDLTVFRRMAKRNKVGLGKYGRSHAVVFARPDARRYGSQQAAQQARLDAAMEIDSLTAIQGTFWGMFQ